jgi:Serine aminopeptidase, S33
MYKEKVNKLTAAKQERARRVEEEIDPTRIKEMLDSMV